MPATLRQVGRVADGARCPQARPSSSLEKRLATVREGAAEAGATCPTSKFEGRMKLRTTTTTR